MAQRYLAFHGMDWEGGGGMRDLVGTADTLEAACEVVVVEHSGYYEPSWDAYWWHIYDTVEGKTYRGDGIPTPSSLQIMETDE